MDRDHCLAHLEEGDLQAELNRIGKAGSIDARGVRFTQQLLARVLDTLLQDTGTGGPHRLLPGQANFDGAYFEGDSDFSSVVFAGRASFNHATFELQEEGPFYDTTFQDEALFMHSRFEDAGFFESEFKGNVRFSYSEIHGTAWFRHAVFHGMAHFDRTVFSGEASFQGCQYYDYTTFTESTFRASVDFDDTQFKTDLFLTQTRFESPVILGKLTSKQTVSLDQATFLAPAEMEIAATRLLCRKASFPGGIHMRIRSGTVDCSDAVFTGPSSIWGVQDLTFRVDLAAADFVEGAGTALQEELMYALAREPAEQREGEPEREGESEALKEIPVPANEPWLVSLAGAEVANLTVSGMDLSLCRFYQAHNLDQIRLEGDLSFGGPPEKKLLTRRKLLSEERLYRDQYGGVWYYDVEFPADRAVYLGPTLEPSQIAGIYRALRKSREDSRDEPGAADFYYGEMEMRRLACKARSRRAWEKRAFFDWVQAKTESFILFLYWLISGYGLRAWRAIAVLAFLVALSTAYFALAGDLGSSANVSTALLFSLQSITALLRGSERQLSLSGEWVQLLLRFIGPILIGLAILSIRGRVKR
jgi:uncharacterized protein YjbI with pentapeptide repeats